MKNLIYFAIPLIIAVLVAVFVHNWLSQYDDPGYALLGFGHWSVESSLVIFAVAQVIIFFIFYMLFRFLGWLMRFPGRMKRKGKRIKFDRSQEALIAGLVDSAEGNFEKAEKVLIKHAANSGAPLLHYLTAARAAQSRGDLDKRNEYLDKASAQSSDTDIAVGLTQAELHMNGQEFDQALKTLTNLQSIAPSHATVLKMLHQAYHLVGDWEGIRALIPSLHKNKILIEAEIKLLETETYSGLLKKAAESNNSKVIQECWDKVPEHIKSAQGLTTIYFAAMIEAGAGREIVEPLVNTLLKHWDATLLVLYANIEPEENLKHLQTAEKWLAVHSTDAVLLRILGKISFACEQKEKAEQYLVKSIANEPTVAAYQLLGDLLVDKGEIEKANDNFRKGLKLASNQVVDSANAFVGA